MYAWTCRFCIVVRNISKVLLPVCTYLKCKQLCEILLSIVYVCWTMGFTTYIQMCHWNVSTFSAFKYIIEFQIPDEPPYPILSEWPPMSWLLHIVDLELCPFWHLLWIINCMLFNHISGIMVSLLASSVVDRGFEPWLVKPQTIKLVFVASALSTQQFRSNS
jgi:hypothetical protein